MKGLFNGYSNLKKLKNIYFNKEYFFDICYMFYECSSFNELDLLKLTIKKLIM